MPSSSTRPTAPALNSSVKFRLRPPLRPLLRVHGPPLIARKGVHQTGSSPKLAESPSTLAQPSAKLAESPSTLAQPSAKLAESPSTLAPLPAKLAESPSTLAQLPAKLADGNSSSSCAQLPAKLADGSSTLAQLSAKEARRPLLAARRTLVNAFPTFVGSPCSGEPESRSGRNHPGCNCPQTGSIPENGMVWAEKGGLFLIFGMVLSSERPRFPKNWTTTRVGAPASHGRNLISQDLARRLRVARDSLGESRS